LAQPVPPVRVHTRVQCDSLEKQGWVLTRPAPTDPGSASLHYHSLKMPVLRTLVTVVLSDMLAHELPRTEILKVSLINL